MDERARIEGFLRGDPALHAYELGDLDPFYEGRIAWAVAEDAVALLFEGGTLVCMVPGEPARSLIRAMTLPDRLYAHVREGVVDALPHRVGRRIPSVRMRLATPVRGSVATEALGPPSADELSAFYAEAYPDNFFDPRMLQAEPYAGLREGGRLVAVAGLHVWSPAHRVAAIGNVAVHPDARGRGLGGSVTAALCERIANRVDTVALNVHADNVAARRAYARIGFVEHA
ncbi:MAG: GNAT family N-acetyltransferase, partial [Myxococcales bacterium]|nr:GNAT family N-acetyltransferase [Myxococcales bacterium]